jgi:hypothetical protein
MRRSFNGTLKNGKSWRRSLTNLKVPKKMSNSGKRKIHFALLLFFGPLVEKLLGLISQTVISGCPEVVEAGFGSSGEPAAPELDISDLVS